ncbi:MAG: hypothetical protein ERJ69_05120, partial [Aphanocapsa feldmannii 288cV]
RVTHDENGNETDKNITGLNQQILIFGLKIDENHQEIADKIVTSYYTCDIDLFSDICIENDPTEEYTGASLDLGTPVAALIAGGKDDTQTNGMHGVAYNASIEYAYPEKLLDPLNRERTYTQEDLEKFVNYQKHYSDFRRNSFEEFYPEFKDAFQELSGQPWPGSYEQYELLNNLSLRSGSVYDSDGNLVLDISREKHREEYGEKEFEDGILDQLALIVDYINSDFYDVIPADLGSNIDSVFEDIFDFGEEIEEEEKDTDDQFYTDKIVAMHNGWQTGLSIRFLDEIYPNQTKEQKIERLFNFLGSEYREANEYLFSGIIESDLVILFGTGDDGKSEPDATGIFPYYYEALKDNWLMVASVDQDNVISSFSNHCGVAMDFCISAPGEGIYSAIGNNENSDNSKYADDLEGTALAAAHVAGAVALLKQQFPSMSGPQIIDRLKKTAEDLGEPGVDNIYGYGLLNLKLAAEPEGSLSVAVGNDVRTAAAAPLSQTLIAPMGPVGTALADTLDNKRIAVLDDIARPYYIPLSALSIDSGSGFGKSWNAQADYLLALGQGNDRIKAPMLFGSAVLSNAIRPCLGGSSLNQAYLLAYGGDCSSSVVWIGDTSLSLSLSDLSNQQSQGVYSAFDVGVPFAAGVLELGFGVLDERESLLGSPLSGGFAIDGRAQTAFLRSGYQRPIASDWLGFVNLAVGETSYGSSGILSDAELTTWSWSAGLHTTDLLRSDDVLALSVKTPLAVSSGHVDYELPSGRTPSTDGRQTYGLTTTRIREELGSEDVVPLDLAVSYGMDLGNWDVNVGLMARTAELQVDDYIVNLNMGFSF